jgi:hypothetical protein
MALATVPTFAAQWQDPVNRNYVMALAAADRFLHAWQSQDQESGLVMLSDAAKEHSSEDKLQQFFSPGESGAYQISAGKRLKPGRYAFPVALFSDSGKPRRRFAEIVVVRTGKDWVVDRLP